MISKEGLAKKDSSEQNSKNQRLKEVRPKERTDNLSKLLRFSRKNLMQLRKRLKRVLTKENRLMAKN